MYSLSSLYFRFKNPHYNYVDDRDFEQDIAERIKMNVPTVVGRIGATECSTIVASLIGNKNKKIKMCDQLYRWSGFFPNNYTLLDKFTETYTKALADVDYIHPLNKDWDEYVYHKFCKKNVKLIGTCYIPFLSEFPWTKHLKGKKVLVIHPFEDSIKKQYSIREKLFSDPEILPDFELITLKAVQTIADSTDDRFETWFDALQWMKDEMDKIEYDVALIGCGAYGLPLASHAKDMGKVAVHMGGILQMYFGILGGRWIEKKEAFGVGNEFWIKPLETEKPEGFEKVEVGCYW